MIGEIDIKLSSELKEQQDYIQLFHAEFTRYMEKQRGKRRRDKTDA